MDGVPLRLPPREMLDVNFTSSTVPDPAQWLAAARACESDKFSHRWYLAAYWSELGSRSLSVRSVLEIGTGASYSLWRSWFPHAHVIGLDNDPRVISRCPGDAHLIIADVSNSQVMEEVAREKGPFDVVIDDGSHLFTDQMAAFSAFWPAVAPGGCYVIEDLHVACEPWHAGSHRRSIADFIAEQSRILGNTDWARPGPTLRHLSLWPGIAFLHRPSELDARLWAECDWCLVPQVRE